MARQPKRRYRLKTAKSGRRRKTSNDTVKYRRVGARRSRYGEKTMARQPKRRYRLKTAKSGRRRKTSNDTVEYSRVGARRSRYGGKPWRASQNDGPAKPGRKSLPRQRNGHFLCRDNSVGLLHKLTGRGPRGG